MTKLSIICTIFSMNMGVAIIPGPLLCLKVLRWKGGTSQQQQLHQGPQMGRHLWRMLHVPWVRP